MMQGVRTLLYDLPYTIKAYTVANADLSHTIVINAHLNQEARIKAYKHELEHISNEDYYKNCGSDIIEMYAHK